MKIQVQSPQCITAIPIAKKKMLELRSLREKTGTVLLTKRFSAGLFTILLSSATWGDTIRILGGEVEPTYFLCHPRFSVGELDTITARLSEFYTITFRCFGHPGYDTKREEITASPTFYPLQDSDHGTSRLSEKGNLLPTKKEDYGNLDWKGDGRVLTWKGAHSRYGVPYDAGVSQLYTPLTSASCYEKGKALKALPNMFVLPEDYLGGPIPDISTLEELVVETMFYYGAVPMVCRGAAYFIDGPNTWLVNIGSAWSYQNNFVMALQVGKDSNSEWLCKDKDGNSAWMIAGVHSYRVNTSWFFSKSGSKAVATENYKMHLLTLTTVEGLPSASFVVEDTYFNVQTAEPFTPESGTTITETGDGITEPKITTTVTVSSYPRWRIYEKTSGVFAADYKGETLVTASVEQIFDGSDGASYRREETTASYIVAGMGGEETSHTTTNQTNPDTTISCTTKLYTDFGTYTLQNIDYYYALNFDRIDGYTAIPPHEEDGVAIPRSYANYIHTRQGTISTSDSLFAEVLFLDLRHDLIATVEREFKGQKTDSGNAFDAEWISLLTPYYTPGIGENSTYDESIPAEDTGNTARFSGMGCEGENNGGVYLGIFLISALFSDQFRLVNPRLPTTGSDVFTGTIDAHFSEHPVGSFCVAPNGIDYFYSFQFDDQIFTGTSLVSLQDLYKQTYDNAIREIDPSLQSISKRAYFPIGLF